MAPYIADIQQCIVTPTDNSTQVAANANTSAAVTLLLLSQHGTLGLQGQSQTNTGMLTDAMAQS